MLFLCEGTIKTIKKTFYLFNRWIWTRVYSITAKPCMESATCCGMELIAKQSYGIKPQKNAPLVMPYACGDTIHANAWFHTKPAAWIKNDKFQQKFVVFWCGWRDLLRFAITPVWQMMGVHHLSQTSNKICHSVCDTHPFKSLIEWSVQKNGLCQIDIAIFGAPMTT